MRQWVFLSKKGNLSLLAALISGIIKKTGFNNPPVKHMKKTIFLSVVLLLVFAFAPYIAGVAPKAQAISIDDLRAAIANLEKQIQELKKQINELRGGATGTTTPSNAIDTGTISRPCYVFWRNMKVGDRGEDVEKLQEILKEEGFEIKEKNFGQATKKAIEKFQEENETSILLPYGLAKGTGYFGPSTRSFINKLYRCNRLEPIIKSIEGPETLAVGEKGVWKVRAVVNKMAQGGDTLRYSVDWGDKFIAIGAESAVSQEIVSQSATFEHTYSATSTYVITFTVSNQYGSIVGRVKVRVGSEAESEFIKVISPNGGEEWRIGETRNIRWKDKNGGLVDIFITSYKLPCPVGADCTSSAPTFLGPIATNVPSSAGESSYNWIIGTSTPVGRYRIRICDKETGLCDSSNKPFEIKAALPSVNLPPVIIGISGPTTLNINQSGVWTVSAYDPENGPLTYDASWGDTISTGSTVPMEISSSNVASTQTAEFAHTYLNTGSYTVSFSVKDGAENITRSSISVYVR